MVDELRRQLERGHRPGRGEQRGEIEKAYNRIYGLGGAK
jgi:hypothetical protein